MNTSSRTRRPPEPDVPAKRERWAVDAGERDVARLDIPPDAQRERRFEVSCSLVVKRRAGADDEAWHALKVLVDGAQQWARRSETHAGPHDSLDVQFRRSVPVGQPMRLTAIGEVKGAARLRLTIVAEEE